MPENLPKTVYCVYLESTHIMPDIVAAYTDEIAAWDHVLARAVDEGYDNLDDYYEARECDELHTWYTVIEAPLLTEFYE